MELVTRGRPKAEKPAAPRDAEPESAWDRFWSSARPDEGVLRAEAQEFVRRLALHLPLERADRVLDFGCGFGFVAAALAPGVDEIYLWDKHERVRQLAGAQVAAISKVRMLDSMPPTPGSSVERFDLILVNSVVQYMTPDELAAALSLWSGLLAPTGRLVLSDLIPPRHPVWRDLFSLLAFEPLGQLRRTGRELRAYLGARLHNGLRPVDPTELEALAATFGLRMQRLPENLTHFSGRFAVVLTPAEAPRSRRTG